MNKIHPQELFDLSTYRHAYLFLNISMPWDALKKIKEYLTSISLGKIEVGVPTGAHLIQKELISIGKGSIIEPGAYIKGPCIIGENCTIRQGAYIRGDVVVGDSCVIGHDTEIKNSILLNHAQAAHFAYIGDCILGNYVNLGAGTKCANLRLDHQEISIFIEGTTQSTGLKKLGAILGDGTQLGCNSVTNPGTITGKGVLCHPCLNFGGVIASHSTIKAPTSPVIILKKD